MGTALCDVEMAGQRIAAGEMVALLLSGANRDPQVFADPERFRTPGPMPATIWRSASCIHACLGAALARIEGATALRALFEAYPDLELTAPPQRPGLVNRRGFSRAARKTRHQEAPRHCAPSVLRQESVEDMR